MEINDSMAFQGCPDVLGLGTNRLTFRGPVVVGTEERPTKNTKSKPKNNVFKHARFTETERVLLRYHN